jgi:hypothetical protein
VKGEGRLRTMSSRRLNTRQKEHKDGSDKDGDVLNSNKRQVKTAANDGDANDSQDLAWLEAELEKVNLELTTVRIERDKQRKQLSTLESENDQLTQQKEQRVKRHQLQNQLRDVERSVRKMTNKKLRAVEDLEQSKSRHRQLGKTMDLLEKGVQSILAKSYYYEHKDKTTEEGKLRTQKRQEELKKLLAEKEGLRMKLLTSSASNLNFGDASRSRRNMTAREDEDDEIHDGDEDRPITFLFADKNKRTNSCNSEVSENDYLEQAAQVYRVPSAAYADSSNRRSRSRSRSRPSSSLNKTSRSPSKSRSSRDRSTRSNKSNSQHNKSQSGRRGGKRPSKNKDDGDETINHSTSNSKKSDLASMIESSRSDHSDDESEDTPKTANTNG